MAPTPAAGQRLDRRPLAAAAALEAAGLVDVGASAAPGSGMGPRPAGRRRGPDPSPAVIKRLCVHRSGWGVF
jgi:hypothetical protein